MADGSGAQDVLGLKARAAQRAFEARGMSPAKALRRALSRSADLLWGLAMVSQGVQIDSLDQDEVIEAISPEMLLLLLDGPDGALGICTVDREVLTGVIEVQTIQQVTTFPADDRPLTVTDAAMVAPLIDAALVRFADNLDDHPLTPQLRGYRFGAMLEDGRAASLLLDGANYHSFEIRLDIALGRRKGIMRFILPERKIREPVPDVSASEHGVGPHTDALSQLPVRLKTVLARLRMPLSKAQNLQVGDLLDLPGDVTDGLTLTAGRNQTIARGRLGQLNGMRAIRLTWPKRMDGASPSRTASGSSKTTLGQESTDRAARVEMPDDTGASSSDAGSFDMAMAEALPVSDDASLPDLPPLNPEGMGDFDFGIDPVDGNFADGDGSMETAFGSAPMDIDFKE